MSKSILSIVSILSVLTSLFFFSSTPTNMGAGETGSLIFRSSPTCWEWHLGQIEITFLDTLWVMAALIIIMAVVAFAARNARRKTIMTGIGAVLIAFSSVDFGIILFGNFLKIFVQIAGGFGPILAWLLIR